MTAVTTALSYRRLLLSLALSLLGCQRDREQLPEARGEERREWVFIFHLPNDNDLDQHAASIRGSIRRGLRGNHVAATLLVDRSTSGGLQRVALTEDDIREETLETDDSADVAVLESYLNWASETFPAHRYAIALLGHGGRLDEVALDLQPMGASKADPRWASSKAVGEVIRRWKSGLAEGSELELLFLHQCGRATLEGLYSFRGTAAVIVASETFVGAPNTYYRPVLERLGEHPETGGAALAESILETERHAAALAVFDGSALAELPTKANALVDAFRRPDGKRLIRPLDQLATFGFGGEVTYDMCSYLNELSQRNGLSDDEAITKHLRWFSDDLIMARRARHLFFPRVDDSWCGIAMLVPWTPDLLNDYDDVLFYQQSRWRDLIGRLSPPRVVPGMPEITSSGSR